MNFAAPQALLLLLVVLAVGGQIWLTFRWKGRMLKLFAQDATIPSLTGSVSRFRRSGKAALTVIALAAAVFALARPYVGEKPQPARATPSDLLVLLDVSLSMAAQDVQPSRFALAQQEIFGLLDRLNGGRIGLVVFGGSAALRFPLTFDYDAARVLARAVEIDSAPSPGTALAEGVRTAVTGLRQSEAPVRAILLLSDGEDFGGPLEEVLQQVAEAGIPVHVVGMGTPQGSTIPVKDSSGAGATFKRDRSGQMVITRLNEPALQHLAASTNGSYQRATPQARELQDILEKLVRQENQSIEELAAAPANDLTPYFALLTFLLLVMELLIPERRGGRALPAVLLVLLPLSLLTTPACVRENDEAFELNQLGSQRYHQAQYGEALEAFRQAQVKRPDLAELNFNAGDALYKTQEFQRAVRETQRALSDQQGGLRADAYFNMGNAYFQLERFQDAFEEYKRALREAPQDLDAKINLELALRRLTEQGQSQGNQGDRSEQQQGGQDQQKPEDQQQGQGQRNADDQEAAQPGDPSQDPPQDLKRALENAGQELTIEEVLRILDALRERERRLQTEYHERAPRGGATSRPEKDW